METKTIIAKAVQVIGFLFAAFGGFLTDLAPPEEADAAFAVGISSFLALCVLLGITAATRGNQGPLRKRLWLSAAAVLFVGAAGSAFVYWSDMHRLTYSYPPDDPTSTHVAGTEWTEMGRAHVEANPGETISQMVAGFEGPQNRELIWTRESISAARLRLVVVYTLVVLCIASTIFTLTEGVLVRPIDATGTPPPS